MINQSVKKIIFTIIGSLFICVANAATGHYYLHGITEVGSEMRLYSDGNYQAILVYGATDIESSGTWQQKDNIIKLQPNEQQQSIFKGLKLILQQDKLYPQDSPLSEGYYQSE